MSFKCSGCGSCCKHVDRAVEATKNIEELYFPYSWDETGRCEHLGLDNKCIIYDNRPLLCNVDAFIAHFGLNEKEFYTLNKEACNQLMDEENVDLYFRL